MIHPDSAFSLSVIIPLYNGADWIESTLQHVIDQTIQPDEIIVIDDGSQDDGARIVERLAKEHEGLIQLHHKSNSGVANTRNTGIKIARGQLILFLDQDDLLYPETLQKHLEVWKSQPNVQLTRVNETVTVVEGYTRPAWAAPESLDKVRPGGNFSSFVFHRSLFDIVGLMDESYSMASDSDWLSRAKEKNVVFTYIDYLGVKRRIHDSNHSSQVTTAQQELTKLLHASIRRRRENNNATESKTD